MTTCTHHKQKRSGNGEYFICQECWDFRLVGGDEWFFESHYAVIPPRPRRYRLKNKPAWKIAIEESRANRRMH